jgi:hypothetical protein
MKCLPFSLICAIALIAGITGCRKDNRLLGAGVLPEDDLHSTDYAGDLAVYGYSKGPDAIPSFNDRTKYLGSNNDPQFGRTDVGLYVNLNITSALSFSTSVFSSAEIILAIDRQVEGDSTSALTYSVFTVRTDSTLNYKRVYYTSATGIHDNVHLGTPATVNFSWKDGQRVVRIPLDPTYAQSLVNDNVSLSSNANLQAKFKGFYIACGTTGEGVIYKCDLDHTQSGLFINYKDSQSDTVIKSQAIRFSGESAVRFNTVSHDPATANASLKSQLSGDTAAGASGLFVKGMGVNRAKIFIPFLKNYGDTFNVAVNRAEVIFYVDRQLIVDPLGRYPVPPTLALLPVSVLDRDTFALDQANTTDNARYDGRYDLNLNAYVFNIARHAQAILKGEKANRGFHLVVATPEKLSTARRDNFMQRVILSGFFNSTYKPRMNLSYIRLKE